MKKVIYVIAILAIFLSLILFSIPGVFIRYDNVSDSSDLITVAYPFDTINALKLHVQNKRYTYWDLSRDFKVECVRKTYQGFYAIFLQTNGDYAYVFMDKELQVNKVLILDSFLSLNDFDVVSKGEKSIRISDILSLDVNSVSIPLSMYIQTAHIVQEGVVYISYSPIKQGVYIEEPVAANVLFYSNEYLMLHQDELIAQCVPFVLSIDKVK